jgi:site-specific recombinase XerD
MWVKEATMKQARNRFGEYLQRRYGDRSTPKHYLNDMDLFIKHIGQKPPQKVMIADVNSFVDQQLARGLRPATINRRLSSIHTFFEYMAFEEQEGIQVNPVNWQLHRIKEGERLPRDASEADVARLFTVLENVRDLAMFGLMVGAGLRVGEVAALSCQALEEPQAGEENGRLRVCGKGKKERIVWVTPRWYGALKKWLAQRPRAETDHLFLNQHQGPLTVAGIQYRLKQHCQLANIQLTCHQLRHTFARRLAEQRMPTESIAELLGHANVSTTQRYTAGANPDLRDAFLEAMMRHEAHPVAELAFVPPARVPRKQEGVDPELLTMMLERLESLPSWLQPVLGQLCRRRWQQWQPHTARKLALNLVGQLLRVWNWLLTEREVSGWETIRRQDIEAWMTARQIGGGKANTIRVELGIFKACVREASAQSIPLSADLLRIKPPAQPRALPRYLTPEQMQRLMQTVANATDNDEVRGVLDRAWFLTLTYTGLRLSELLNLRLSDLDFTGGRLFVVGGKNSPERVIYLTPALTSALAQYLTQRPASSDDHLWLKPSGKLLQPWTVTNCLRRWGSACNVSVSAHRLRHTFATQLVNQGLSLTSIAKLLGHQTLNMTQHYARLYEHTVKEQFEKAIASIEGIFAPDWPTPAVSVPDTTKNLVNMIDSV